MPGLATMTDVYNFLAGDGKNKPNTDQKAAYPLARFRAHWGELTDQDKADLRTGIGDGSFNY